jgi:hypothetical protein
VTDSVGGTVEKDDIPASNATGRGFSTTVNVQPLVDGPLTVDTYASDDAGNLSSKDEPTPNNAPSDKETVNLAIDSADSFVTVHGDNVPFSQVAGQRIALPQSITLKFNEPIRSAVVDTAPPNSSSSPKTLFSANLCLADNTGFCVATAKPVALTQDQEGLVLTPAGGASSPKPGVYSIRRVTAPAATQGSCPDRSVSNMLTTTDQSIVTNCERVDTGNGVRGTDPVLTFTIDDIAPTPTFTAFSPSLVTGATVHNVSISGTTDADTARVQLLIKSSGGGTPKLINVPVTPPSDPNAATVGWSVSSVDLSTLPDGSLTVSATATDLAGNVTPNPVVLSPAPTLAAHLSWLTESTSSRQVTYGKLIRLAGRLTDNSGVGIANAPLSIKPQFDNGKFGSAFGTTTDANGYWAMLVGPTQNATYWASYAGSSTGAFHDAVTVHTARTLVLARIFFLSPRYGAKVKSPVVLKGQVSPNKAGKYVYFYRHTKTHNYYLGRAKLGRSSRWAFKLSLRRGTTYVFAKIGNTYGNRGNRTGYLKLRH